MKVSKPSKYQTQEKPNLRNWPWRDKKRILWNFYILSVAKHQEIEGKKFGEKKSSEKVSMPIKN